MEPQTIGLLSLVIFVFFLFFGVPIGIGALVAAITGFSLLRGAEAGIAAIGTGMFGVASNFIFTVVPLFILMGDIASEAGIMRDAYDTASKWLGRLRGGMAVATIAGAAAFAAVCGASIAACAALAKVTLPEMKRLGYSQKLAAGSAAAGATLGILIPPSIPLVLFGMLTGTSIGKLLLAGFIPGIVAAILYAITIIIWVRINPSLAPMNVISSSWKEKFISLKNTAPFVVLIIVVLGSIYGGIATPTEAAAMGALGAFLIALFMKRLTRANVAKSLRDTAITTSGMFLLVIGALLFVRVIELSGLPGVMSAFLLDLNLPPLALVMGVIVLYLILGMFVDGFSMMVLTLPFVFPMMIDAGYNPVWFGIITIRLIEIGNLTPPFGLNLFVMKASAPDVPMSEVIRGVQPFILTDILSLGLFIAFPSIALFLPSLMK